ncbi:MAG TPA: hypothetical protein VF326_06130 [Anaerolineaceae bacterium]
MSKRSWFILALILAAVGGFYLATLRSGHPWGDDFSMYIAHARNIVQGVDYQATGYIYDRMFAVIGPRYYPPVYPLTLAPVVALFGLNLTAMKVEIIAFFLLFLFVLAFSFRRELSWIYLASAVAVLGFNPSLWDFKDDPTSDILFLLILYLCFFTIQRVYTPGREKPPGLSYGLLTGVLIACADSTRSVGILILPALVILDIVRTRRLRLFPWAASAVAGLGYLVQSLAIRGPSGYEDQAVFYPRVFPINLHAYFDALGSLWSNGYFPAVQMAVYVSLFGLALYGAITRLKRGITIYELFSVFYIILIIIWRANQGVRFLLPLIPLFVIDLFAGLQQIGRSAWPRAQAIQRAASVTVLAVLALSYVGVYSKTSFGPFDSGVERPASVELFDFIQHNTQKGDVIIFSRPRALALYTGRKAAGYSALENEQFTINYSKGLGASYFLVGPGDNYLRLLVKRYPGDFAPIYKNADFSLYRFSTP